MFVSLPLSRANQFEPLGSLLNNADSVVIHDPVTNLMARPSFSSAKTLEMHRHPTFFQLTIFRGQLRHTGYHSRPAVIATHFVEPYITFSSRGQGPKESKTTPARAITRCRSNHRRVPQLDPPNRPFVPPIVTFSESETSVCSSTTRLDPHWAPSTINGEPSFAQHETITFPCAFRTRTRETGEEGQSGAPGFAVSKF